jgi:hypothetical protein
MTAFTTASAGDILTASNWTGGVLPDFTIAGDTWTLNHAMTASVDWAVGGAGPVATIQLLISPTGSFTQLAGRMTVSTSVGYNGGAMDQLKIAAGAAMRAAGGAGLRYLIGPNAAGSGSSTCGITMLGTANSRITVDAAANSSFRFSQQSGTNKSGFHAEYTDFIGLGTSGTNIMDINSGGAGQPITLLHCTDTSCGGKAFYTSAAGDLSIQYHKTITPLMSVLTAQDWFFSGTAATTGLRVFKYISAWQSMFCWNATSMSGWVIENCTVGYWNPTGLTNSTPPTSIKNIFLFSNVHTHYIVPVGGTATGIVAWVQNGYTPFTNIQASGYTGTGILDNAIHQTDAADSSEDGSSFGAVNAANTHRVQRYITLKNSAGTSSGGIIAEHSTKYTTEDIRHVTQNLAANVTGTLNVMGGAVYHGHAGQIARVEDSIFFAYGTLSSPGYPIIQYCDTADAPGDEPDHSVRNIVTDGSGNTATVLKFAGKSFDTSTSETLADAGMVLRVTATVAGGPAIGEECTVTSNTATTITVSGGFTGTVWDGITVFGKVVNQVDPTKVRNNYYFGAGSGTNYDTTCTALAPIVGLSGFVLSGTTNTNSVDAGAGTDPVANGPKFLLEESSATTGNWDMLTIDYDWMGFSVDPAWVANHSYAVGDYVSHSSSDYFPYPAGGGNRTVGFMCIQAHTSSSTNDVNEPGKRPGSSAFRNYWVPSFLVRLSLALAADTRYSNPNILYLGDTANTPATNINALEMLMSRIRHAKRPTNPTLLAMAANSQDGICPGAVDGNIALPLVAAKLAVTSQPTTVSSGVTFGTSVVITVQTSGGSTVTSDTSTVSLALNIISGSVSLSGTTSKAAVAGVATFSDLSVTCSNNATFTLTASDGALTSATTSTITGSAGTTTYVPIHTPIIAPITAPIHGIW